MRFSHWCLWKLWIEGQSLIRLRLGKWVWSCFYYFNTVKISNLAHYICWATDTLINAKIWGGILFFFKCASHSKEYMRLGGEGTDTPLLPRQHDGKKGSTLEAKNRKRILSNVYSLGGFYLYKIMRLTVVLSDYLWVIQWLLMVV